MMNFLLLCVNLSYTCARSQSSSNCSLVKWHWCEPALTAGEKINLFWLNHVYFCSHLLCVLAHSPVYVCVYVCVCLCVYISSFLPPVLAAAVTQASLRSVLHKLLTAGPAFNVTALLSAAQHSNQGMASPLFLPICYMNTFPVSFKGSFSLSSQIGLINPGWEPLCCHGP